MIQQSMESFLRTSLSFWRDLTPAERQNLSASSTLQKYKPGALIHNCTSTKSPGVQIVKRGRARAFISSPEGRQLTLQRIRDNQLFSLGISCVFDDIVFDVSLETETPCEIVSIPRDVCKRLFDANPKARSTAYNIMLSRFASTMRVLEAITFTSTKSRLANALIEQSVSAGSLIFNATHASLAADIGSTREVVTRLLNQFQTGGLLTLLRGQIRIEDRQALIDMRG